MAEGAQLPWKIQKINTDRGPPAEYRSLYKALPGPPDGLEWERDEDTRHWMLVPKKKASSLTETQVSVGTSTTTPAGARPPVSPTVTKHDCKKVSPSQKMVLVDSDNSSPSSGSNEEAVEGIDYVVHTVLPTDTLCGICLSYRVKATKLRQVNKFSGSKLLISSKLVIPLTRNEMGKIRLQDRDSPEYKIHSFQAELPALSSKEARAYLELSDWNLVDAIVAAKEDIEWERSQQSSLPSPTRPTLTSLEESNTSCVTLDVHVAIPARKSAFDGSKERFTRKRWDRFRSIPSGELEMRSLMTPLI